MGKRLYHFILIVAITAITQQVFAQSKNADDEGEISTELIPANKNAIFDDAAKYTFEVKNTTNTNQVGRVSYTVTTETGKKLKQDSVRVSISKKSTERYSFEIPQNKPGFYKVNFMINVSDYDDTTRRAFGIKPEQLVSAHPKPADFDAFWQTAKDDLAKVQPDFKTTLVPKLCTNNRNVYLIEMKSLDNLTIRGWLTEPKVKNKKFAVILGLPGYQIDLSPILGEDKDVAFITLNVRGQGNSRDSIHTRRDEFIVRHIEDKNKYVMRGVVMDCIRAMDYIYSRPELKHDNIFVKGGSMGAYLAITTACLDKRVNLCSAQSPIMADIRNLVTEVDFPIKSIERYIQVKPGLTLNKILDNLDYFDVKNFAPGVKCKVVMSIGLLDTYVPPDNGYVVYNSLTTSKKLFIYKDLGHEASPEYIKMEGGWMHDQFGLY